MSYAAWQVGNGQNAVIFGTKGLYLTLGDTDSSSGHIKYLINQFKGIDQAQKNKMKEAMDYYDEIEEGDYVVVKKANGRYIVGKVCSFDGKIPYAGVSRMKKLNIEHTDVPKSALPFARDNDDFILRRGLMLRENRFSFYELFEEPYSNWERKWKEELK
ncbi:MAG: hypothetical protein K6G10_04785 [Butyrivibrio sp.]|nr:hypothetical protein [Butyrivibrio sp.]